MLGLVVALVLEALATARGVVRREERSWRAARLRAALADAARQALQRLADDEDLQVDHLREPWAQPVDTTTPSGVAVWLKITDEERFFDLNNLAAAPGQGVRPAPEILADLLTLCGDFAPLERVEALGDWIDPDDEGFWETSYYRGRDPPYACANTWLRGWFELPWVAGFTRRYFELRPRLSRGGFDANPEECLTVVPGARSRPTPVNVNTAGRETLWAVLGLEHENLAHFVVLAREDRPFGSLEPLARMGDATLLERVRPYLAVRSRTFRIEARAFEAGQAERLWVLARRGDDGSVRVLRWVY